MSGVLGMLARYRERLQKDRTFAGALVLLIGSVFGYAITFAFMPVLTRVATPDDMGHFARFVSTVGVLLPVVSLRYEWAIPLAGSATGAARLFELSLWLLLGCAAIVALATLAMPLVSVPVEGMQYVSGGMGYYVAVGIVVLGTVQALSGWTIRTSAFTPMARARVMHSVLVGTIQVSLALAIGGPQALMIGFLLGQVLAYSVMFRGVMRDVMTGRREPSAPSLSGVAREYVRFPTISAPSSLINSLGVEAPILLISSLAGAATAGQLALAQRVAALPGMLVTQSLGQSFYAEAARLAREDPVALRALYRRTVRQLGLAGLLVFIALLLAPLAFPIIFGAQWHEAGYFALQLGVMVWSQLALGTVSCLEYLGQQGLNLLWNIGRLLVVAGGIGVPFALGGSGSTMIVAYSVAAALWYPVLYLMNERSLARAIAQRRPATEQR